MSVNYYSHQFSKSPDIATLFSLERICVFHLFNTLSKLAIITYVKQNTKYLLIFIKSELIRKEFLHNETIGDYNQ